MELQYLHLFILFIIIERTVIGFAQLLPHAPVISFSLMSVILIVSFFITVVVFSFFPVLFLCFLLVFCSISLFSWSRLEMLLRIHNEDPLSYQCRQHCIEYLLIYLDAFSLINSI